MQICKANVEVVIALLVIPNTILVSGVVVAQVVVVVVENVM